MRWKLIPGHTRYEISELGDVRVAGNAPAWGWRKAGGTLLKASIKSKKDRYLIINLIPDEGCKKISYIHQVAITFIGPKPYPEACVLHKDDDKANNHYRNLYWGSKKQNAIDRSINGKGVGKLNLEQVLWVKELYHGDAWSYVELGNLFRVHHQVIRDLIKGKTYGWVNAL